MTGKDASLVGREAELSRLRELLSPPYPESRVLLILGDPGMGKTVLLAEAAREARSAGMRVLAAAGRESERDLAFAGLHQLLRPVLDRVAGLPARQAEALRGAFALSDDPVPPDALLTGIAVLTLLSGLSEDGPLLVVADDAQWLDRASLDALAFAARRLESEQLVLLVGARGNVPPLGFERDFPQLLLRAAEPAGRRPAPRRAAAPAARPAARAGARPGGREPAGADRAVEGDRRRPRRGAPMGRRAASADRPADRHHGRPVRRPAQRGASRAAARRGRRQPGHCAAAVPGLSAGVLAPAEAAGLIRLDTPGPQFTHPLVRSAVYHAAPFAERAAAHLTSRGRAPRPA